MYRVQKVFAQAPCDAGRSCVETTCLAIDLTSIVPARWRMRLTLASMLEQVSGLISISESRAARPCENPVCRWIFAFCLCAHFNSRILQRLHHRIVGCHV